MKIKGQIQVKQRLLILSGMLTVINIYCATAQPSGGPYGPLHKTYSVPEDAGRVFYVSPEGKEENSGSVPEQPAKLEMVVSKAETGDVIILRGGVYRTGDLLFNQGITLQPYRDEKPVLKGTYIADEWQKAGRNIWVTSWDRLFPGGPEDWWRREWEERFTPLHRFNDDMVFVDGRFLQSAGDTSSLDTNTFFVDYRNKLVFIGTDPADRLVEITAFNVAVHRIYGELNGNPSDSIGPVIRGITFTQYADTAILIEGTYPEGLTDEALYGNDVRGTLLENCEISWCSRIGAYLMGDSLTIRNCRVSNTSTEGIYLVGVSDALLEKNIISMNNIEFLTGYFPAGVKIFNQCYRITCRDNLVTDLPNSNGIWYDVGNVDGVFINNRVENVGSSQSGRYSVYKYMSGFFFEISKGAICAGNVFLNCDNGSFVLNSSDVELYQNTYINSKVVFGRTDRVAAGDHFGWHASTGPGLDERDGHKFVNNLVVRNDSMDHPLLEVWQLPGLCDTLTTLQMSRLDYNVYVRQWDSGNNPLIQWSTVKMDSCNYFFSNPAELHDLNPQFGANSWFLNDYRKPVFLDAEHNNFRIDPDFPAISAGISLPDELIGILPDTEEGETYIGAYPQGSE